MKFLLSNVPVDSCIAIGIAKKLFEVILKATELKQIRKIGETTQ